LEHCLKDCTRCWVRTVMEGVEDEWHYERGASHKKKHTNKVKRDEDNESVASSSSIHATNIEALLKDFGTVTFDVDGNGLTKPDRKPNSPPERRFTTEQSPILAKSAASDRRMFSPAKEKIHATPKDAARHERLMRIHELQHSLARTQLTASTEGTTKHSVFYTGESEKEYLEEREEFSLNHLKEQQATLQPCFNRRHDCHIITVVPPGRPQLAKHVRPKRTKRWWSSMR
jgi:hypothetical protein